MPAKGTKFVKRGTAKKTAWQKPSLKPSIKGTRGQRSRLPSITVYHGSSPSQPTQPVLPTSATTVSAFNNNLNIDQQNRVRQTYKQCLDHAAQSGKYMTSSQRLSLQQAIMTESQMQVQPAIAPVLPPSGSPKCPNQSMTMAELVNQLQSTLSTSAPKSPQIIPSSAIPRSA